MSFPKMHVSLYVSNLAATVNFYNSFFGKPANKVMPKYAKYELDSPALIISFVEKPEKVSNYFGHLGFQVETTDEMHAYLDRSKVQGLPVREEMGTACCYALQDKFWVSDPDNYQWEIYYFHNDVEFNDPHYALEESPKQVESANSCAPGSGCC